MPGERDDAALSAASGQTGSAFEPLRQTVVAALLEQLPLAVVLAEAPSGRIVMANRSARESFPDEALCAASIDEYGSALKLDGTEVGPHGLPLARALEGEVVEGERLRFRTGDDSWCTFEVRASPIHDEQGLLIAAVSTLVDVSERVGHERAEREFLANAAHQLRNPLAVIRSAVEVLQAGAKDDEETRDRFLAHLERESERLTQLARSLLLLARAQSMVEQPRREILRVAPLLQELTDRLDPGAQVTVELRCAPDLAVVTNPELLREALRCLADNAVRFTPHGQVVISCREANGSVAIEVRDEGPGIPADIRTRVFDRFYSGEGTGFGLGLAIALQAAEAIDATLELDSRPGQGTTARMLVPAVRMVTP